MTENTEYRPTSPNEIPAWVLLQRIAKVYEYHWETVADLAGAPQRDDELVREHCVDLLVAISALAQRASSQRWPRAVDALNNGADWERVARALGLAPDEMTVGLQTWVDLQRTYGELDDDHLDDLEQLINERWSQITPSRRDDNPGGSA